MEIVRGNCEDSLDFHNNKELFYQLNVFLIPEIGPLT